MQYPSQARSEDPSAEANALLARLSVEKRDARWNFGPTTGSILAAVVAHPDQVRCDLRRLDIDADCIATSTVYVKPPRTMRISVGPSQFYEPSPADDDYQHPAWCECADLMAFVRNDLGLDHMHWPDEMHPAPAVWSGDEMVADDGPWIRLWWD